MDKSTDADLRIAAMFNTSNVAMARSQKILQSWLPTTSSQDDIRESSSNYTIGEDEDDFKELNEISGIGSNSANASDFPDKGALHTKLTSNDRLREQIMGKKAAQAHKKSKEMTVGRSMSAAKPQAPKLAVGAETARAKTVVEDTDDEGEGRAASFKSKRSNARKAPVEAASQDENEAGAGAQDGEEDGMNFAVTENSVPINTDKAADENSKPTKRKAASYLDELLAEKSRKKSRKKKKATPES